MKEVRPLKNKEFVDESSQTLFQSAARSTSDMHKWLREPTVSPEASAAKKPAKRPKASNKEEEWVKVSSRKNLQKKPARTPEKSRCTRPEAVLIKPAEGMSYVSILRELKKRVNPDDLGATV